jgi:tetratricopeptide (TPR) repeat protein
MPRVIHGVGLLVVLLLLGCGQGPTTNVQPNQAEHVRLAKHQAYVQQGRDAMAAKRFAEAEDAFAKAAELMPEDNETRALLQEARGAKQKQIEADYQEAMDTARAALKNKDYQRARDAITEALRLKPGDKEATTIRDEAEFLLVVQRGREAMDAKRYGEAVEAWTAACKLRPDNQECRELLRQAVEARRQELMTAGRAAMEAKKYEEALKLFTEVLRLVPDDKEAAPLGKEAEFQMLVQRGKAALDAKDYVKAVTALEAATRLKPDDDTARDLLRQTIAARKADYDQAMATGNAALRAKNYQAAVKAADDALRLLPGDAEADKLKKTAQKEIDFQLLVQRGQAALDAKRYADAVSAFEGALRLKPDDATARDLLRQTVAARKAAYDRAMASANAALLAQNYQAAVAAADEALRLLPGDRDAGKLRKTAQNEIEFQKLVQQGKAALDAKRYAEAVAACEAAIRLKPDDATARNLLQQTIAARKAAYDRAMATANTALLAKNYKAALSAAEDALRLLPGDREADKLRKTAQKEIDFQMLVQRGKAALDAKRYADAVTALEAAGKLKPDDATARDLLRQIDAARKADYDRAMNSGKAALLAKNYQAAIQAADEALRVLPRDRAAEALRSEAQAEQTKKRDYDAKVTLAQTALARGDFDEAIKQLQAAKDKMPLDGAASALLAQAQAKKTRFEQYMRSGNQYMQSKQYDLAITQFRFAQTEAPSNLEASRAIADAHAKKAKKK